MRSAVEVPPDVEFGDPCKKAADTNDERSSFSKSLLDAASGYWHTDRIKTHVEERRVTTASELERRRLKRDTGLRAVNVFRNDERGTNLREEGAEDVDRDRRVSWRMAPEKRRELEAVNGGESSCYMKVD